MKTSQENPTHWSHHEWDLINVTEIFKHKPAIMKKAESYLEELRSALAAELKAHPKPYPPDTDLTKGQIARGENHKGFPFLSLDIPQKFSKTEFFTYRTLFWWGHYLGFSLILKGPDLDTYLNRLKEFRQDAACENVYLSQHASPWEWEFSENHFSKVSELSENEIQEDRRPPSVSQTDEIFSGIGGILPGTQLGTGRHPVLSRSGSFGFGMIIQRLPLRIFHHGNQGMHPYHLPQGNHL